MLVGVFRLLKVKGRGKKTVVPMLVGVFRTQVPVTTWDSISCPHARGGVPPEVRSAEGGDDSLSPCSWGCSGKHDWTIIDNLSCPHARGGVPMNKTVPSASVRGCPHARGGVPLYLQGYEIGKPRCPHARGGVPVSYVTTHAHV